MGLREAIFGSLISRISSQVGLFQSMTLPPALELMVYEPMVGLTEINTVSGYISCATVYVYYALEVYIRSGICLTNTKKDTQIQACTLMMFNRSFIMLWTAKHIAVALGIITIYHTENLQNNIFMS